MPYFFSRPNPRPCSYPFSLASYCCQTYFVKRFTLIALIKYSIANVKGFFSYPASLSCDNLRSPLLSHSLSCCIFLLQICYISHFVKVCKSCSYNLTCHVLTTGNFCLTDRQRVPPSGNYVSWKLTPIFSDFESFELPFISIFAFVPSQNWVNITFLVNYKYSFVCVEMPCGIIWQLSDLKGFNNHFLI